MSKDLSLKRVSANQQSKPEFNREFRYIVIKISDAVAALSEIERIQLRNLILKIDKYRTDCHKGVMDCVVVESDWPIYEDVWSAIERMSSYN